MSIVRAVLKFSKLAPGWKKKELKRVGKKYHEWYCYSILPKEELITWQNVYTS